MTSVSKEQHQLAALAAAAEYAVKYRDTPRAPHPTQTAEDLRARFRIPLSKAPRDGIEVIQDLVSAAEPGLVGNTQGDFYAWVMGGSNPVGVAADWLTSAWGQNAAIYQTSPAAAIAEEAVSDWLLELLDLPHTSSVGFVTGATMAAFVGLAAARSAVLARAGHDFERFGLQGAPKIHVFLSDDAHITNRTAIRHIGLGDDNCIPVSSDDQGCMRPDELALALAAHDGPKIIVAQAGHINSGAFEDFQAIGALARAHGAWLHIDGAFGLWARATPEKAHLTKGIDLADSWSVDGHKWLQVPYDSGFAIVRDNHAHRLAMDISASYLNASAMDGRNPTHFNPELSRRARGFSAWAVFQSLGVSGIRDLVERHCHHASKLAQHVNAIPGLVVVNDVVLNQVIIGADEQAPAEMISELCHHLNESEGIFTRTTFWKGQEVLRVSVISQMTDDVEIERLTAAFRKLLP